MKFSLRSLLEAVLLSYTPRDYSDQIQVLAATSLDKRSDRVVPGFFLPDTKSTTISEPTPTPPPPSPPPPSSIQSPPPLPATVTITSISTSTSLITTTIDVTVNRTYYVTNTETFTTAIPTTLLTPTAANNTLTIHPLSAGADAKKPVSASEVLAIVSGVANIALLIAMFFLVRRFYKMYRQERVLRKQLQTEGVELS
ncbi:hypothetical protein IMSHALPRED_000561 [Imshaugia aleurites]|uniref:Uncharacterized protein n=1 Tax=Imshaugia aleurites TaxID=172621 RepID=A0A8H3G455_9LECA|nr:hypothetical protein IMSHALPRED_000561 [Imshaugia aleurites]